MVRSPQKVFMGLTSLKLALTAGCSLDTLVIYQMRQSKSRTHFTPGEEDGTRFDPHDRSPTALPRDLPRARRRLVQWLAPRLHHLRHRLHRALHLHRKFARCESLGALD